jgi:hypothetical protein
MLRAAWLWKAATENPKIGTMVLLTIIMIIMTMTTTRMMSLYLGRAEWSPSQSQWRTATFTRI